MRRRAGEPGHEQSCGLFVPGERLGRKAQRGLQGQPERAGAKPRTSTCLSTCTQVRVVEGTRGGEQRRAA